MNYKDTLDWMFSQLPMFQRQGKTAFKKDLTNSIALSKHLNYPEKKFKSIHVAGTNGKGSTSHMIASVLQEAGYKVGLYTSPHLKDFRERIKINGEVIRKTDVIDFVKKHGSFLSAHKLSFFEMTVGLALHSFANENVDVAVIEVGLGGRLDSTNIIMPEVSVITNIGMDHTQFLGNTLPEIAYEKAGIIKDSVPVVVGEFQKDVFQVFEKIAKENNSNLYVASALIKKDYVTDLMGDYQVNNVKTAVQTLYLLKEKKFTVTENNIIRGLNNVVSNTGLLGRWQVIDENPKVICDIAHNKEGLLMVMHQLDQESFENLHIVLGVVNDKDLDPVLPLFPKNAIYYFCKPDIPRGLDAIELQQQCIKYGLIGKTYKSVKRAYSAASKKALADDIIYIGGSTFVVSDIL
jgi:dihydrofolate synthase/folylpolyglutamate synthase